MPNNPKVKVEADLSSFEAELASLQQLVTQLGETLKTSSGKAHFNFDGAQKELSQLISRTDKMTEALNKSDKASAKYVKNLKDAAEIVAKTAKIAAKLEDAGTARNNKTSGYFSTYATELSQDHSDTLRRSIAEKERAALEAKMSAAAMAQSAKWGGRFSKIAGIAGGAVLGGGGTYANIGSILGSSFGFLGSQLGGIAGGAADKFISPSREEAKAYSELRRMVGSTTTDFEKLRDSVRSVITGMGVTDNEAANLAKQFAHTAALTGDATEGVARSIGTSTGFAQGYGMAPEQATSFFAQMRLSGNANNDKDNRRLAMMIGESVQRGGTSAKMDEVLSALSSFAGRSAFQMMTAPNVGQYSSYLASLTGSSYAGLKGDPNNAAQLMSMMDAGVSNGGTMGEASQYHWLQARQSAFKGMSAMDNSLMQTAGITGDLAALFAPGSPAYDNANADARARMDRTRKSIIDSGYRNNFEVGMAHIKAISHGDSYLENANFRGMYGGNFQQAAVIMQQLEKDPGLGNMEKELSKYGVSIHDPSLKTSQIAAFSQLLGGGDKAMVSQYEKLLGSGKLTGKEKDAADKIMAKEGYGEEFKKMLIALTAKYDADDGLKAQTTQIDIANKIQEKVSSLVSIETDSREYLLRLLDRWGSAGPVIDRMLSGFKDGVPESGNNMKGEKGIGKMAMHEVDRNLKEIAMAGSQEERDRLYTDFMRKVNKYPDYYPAETDAWMKKARGGHEAASDNTVLGTDNSQTTISGVVPAYGSGKKGDFIKSNRDYAVAAGNALGVDPDLILAQSAQETGWGQSVVRKADGSSSNNYFNIKADRSWKGKTANGYRAYATPQESFKDYASFINSNPRYKNALSHAGDADSYIEGLQMAGYAEDGGYADKIKRIYHGNDFGDKMPAEQRLKSPGENSKEFRAMIDVNLWDTKGNRRADPVFISTNFGSARPAGS